MAIQQSTDWEGNTYYWDDSSGERVAAPDAPVQSDYGYTTPAPENQPAPSIQSDQGWTTPAAPAPEVTITPENVAQAYQDVTGSPPPPQWVEQTVAAYSGDPSATVANVIRDTTTAASASGTPFANVAGDQGTFTTGADYYQKQGYIPGGTTYEGVPTSFIDPKTGQVVAQYGVPTTDQNTTSHASNLFQWNPTSSLPQNTSVALAVPQTDYNTGLLDALRGISTVAGGIFAPEIIGALTPAATVPEAIAGGDALASFAPTTGAGANGIDWTSVLSQAGKSGALNAAVGAATGQSPNQILKSALSSALSSGLGTAGADLLGGGALAKIIANTAAGAGTSAITGGNVGQGALGGAINATLSSVVPAVTSQVSGVSSLPSSVQQALNTSIASAIKTAVAGGDVGTGALTGLVSSAAMQAGGASLKAAGIDVDKIIGNVVNTVKGMFSGIFTADSGTAPTQVADSNQGALPTQVASVGSGMGQNEPQQGSGTDTSVSLNNVASNMTASGIPMTAQRLLDIYNSNTGQNITDVNDPSVLSFIERTLPEYATPSSSGSYVTIYGDESGEPISVLADQTGTKGALTSGAGATGTTGVNPAGTDLVNKTGEVGALGASNGISPSDILSVTGGGDKPQGVLSITGGGTQPVGTPTDTVSSENVPTEEPLIDPLVLNIAGVNPVASDSTLPISVPLSTSGTQSTGASGSKAAISPLAQAVTTQPAYYSGSSSSQTIHGALPGSLEATFLRGADVADYNPFENYDVYKQIEPIRAATGGQMTQQQSPLQLAQMQQGIYGIDPSLYNVLQKRQTPNYFAYAAQSQDPTQFVGATLSGKPTPNIPLVSQSTPQNQQYLYKQSGAGGSGTVAPLQATTMAHGGDVHSHHGEHVPEFITGVTGHYVKGGGTGQSDSIPAMLADGEFVWDADTVAALGDGSSDAGAKLLDAFRESIRAHKRSAPADKIPPKASPLQYMKEALKRAGRK